MSASGAHEPTWLLDTSVVLDLEDADVAGALPEGTSISVITLAELSAGPLMTADPVERKQRRQRLRKIEAAYDPITVDDEVARTFGDVAAAVRQAGRQPRKRQFDLLIAAVAATHGMPLATRNADDLVGLEGIVDVRPV